VFTRTKEAIEQTFVDYVNANFGKEEGYKTAKYKS